MRSPLTENDGKFNVPCSTKIDIPLIVGASIFGLGWGIGGIFPGKYAFRELYTWHDMFIFAIKQFNSHLLFIFVTYLFLLGYF